MSLYPFKFKAQLLPKVWGGKTIMQWYDHLPAGCDNVGESWVISDYGDYQTEVANGSHEGETLRDLLEVYMDELVGESVYDAFGNQFPLLFKFIDATDDLSIQVHPDDAYAQEHGDDRGKTEMWYVMPSPDDASIYLGWNKPVNKESILKGIEDGTLARDLRDYKVRAGDVAFIPAGTVHALCKNTIVAEIQESSDLTYRLYDYNRPGVDGKLRPLHIDKALDVSDCEVDPKIGVTHPQPPQTGVANAVRCPFFTTNVLECNRPVQRDYAPLDSFVAYMCVEGECVIKALDCESPDNTVSMKLGEAVLVPASLNDILIEPNGSCRLLEIYLEE